MNKFKIGDHVINQRGVAGKVFKIDGKTIHFRAAHGTEFQADESDLKFHYPQYGNKPRLNEDYVGDKCPRCQTPWTITRWGSKAWYHCKPCNKKAEDLILGAHSPPPLPKDKKGAVDDELLSELEQLLSSWNYDDDDFDGIFFRVDF